MARIRLRIVYCVVLGPASAVGVAWAAAIWGPASPIGQITPLTAPEQHFTTGPPSYWPPPQYRVDWKGLGWSISQASREFAPGSIPEQPDAISVSEARFQFGWPCLALEYVLHQYSRNARPGPGTQAIKVFSGDGGLVPHQLAPNHNAARRFPLRPMPLGLTVNALTGIAFFAAILVLPPTLRYWHRRVRGACVGCGYPIGTSPMCPECGNSVQTTRARSGSRNRVAATQSSLRSVG